MPIYVQIVNQVKYLVAAGRLAPGEEIPPIRSLAQQLVVNPNTVAKAYRELEHEGILELRQGAGAFVSDKAPTQQDAERLKAAQALVAQGIQRLRARGITDEEIRRLIEAELSGMYKSGGSR